MKDLSIEKFIKNEFGYCYYVFDKDYNTSEEGNKIHAIIYNLFIYPEFRKQGKAREMLQSVINIIIKMNYTDEIRIEAKPKENCISLKNLVSFYKSMGLKVY